MKKGGERRRQDKANNKRDAMVFGDNVRARSAARALPRTPPTGRGRGRGKGRQRKKGDKRRDRTLSPRRHSPITQPCHKDTTINQQYCDSKHNACDVKREDKKTGNRKQETGDRRQDAPRSSIAHRTPHNTHPIMPPLDTPTALPRPQQGQRTDGRERDGGIPDLRQKTRTSQTPPSLTNNGPAL